MTDHARRGLLPLLAVPVLLFLAVPAPAVEPEQLRRGLVATFRDTAPQPTEITRLEPTVALSLGDKEAPHPRLVVDGGSVVWRGQLNVLRPGPYAFAVRLRGKATVRVGGKVVLDAASDAAQPVLKDGAAVELEAGVLPFEVEFTRPSGVARLELLWQGPGFLREPLPYDMVGHLPAQASPRLAADTLAEQGRFLAEESSCVRCHAAPDSSKMAKGLGSRTAPDLSNIGARARPGWIDEWLADPGKVRPHAAMPNLFHDDEVGRAERYAVAYYLATLGGPLKPASRNTNPNDYANSRERGRRLFTTVGCVVCHNTDDKAEKTEGPSLYGL
jgi:mono/diheme cytochrome c family protein